jgi:opacity protein-like surface antigen
MIRKLSLWAIGAVLCAPACFAQDYEVGGFAGYGFYRHATIIGPGASVQAGVQNRFVGGAVISEQLYDYISGEIRYLYHDGDPFISAGGKRVDIQGHSQSFHYDMLFFVRKREAQLRPFIAVGGGAKWYTVSGPVPKPNGLGGIASVTTRDQWKFLGTIGGGVKYRIHPNVLLRVDVRDYITGFPSALISPAPGNTTRGFFHQITPMLGVSYSF